MTNALKQLKPKHNYNNCKEKKKKKKATKTLTMGLLMAFVYFDFSPRTKGSNNKRK